jgi:hypothetical protein
LANFKRAFVLVVDITICELITNKSKLLAGKPSLLNTVGDWGIAKKL